MVQVNQVKDCKYMCNNDRESFMEEMISLPVMMRARSKGAGGSSRVRDRYIKLLGPAVT